RNTPPKKPTSSPNTTTRSSRSIATAWPSRIALIIVIAGTSETGLLALAEEVWWDGGVDVLAHRRRARRGAAVQRAERLGLLGGGAHGLVHVGHERGVLVLAPRAEADEVGL